MTVNGITITTGATRKPLGQTFMAKYFSGLRNVPVTAAANNGIAGHKWTVNNKDITGVYSDEAAVATYQGGTTKAAILKEFPASKWAASVALYRNGEFKSNETPTAVLGYHSVSVPNGVTLSLYADATTGLINKAVFYYEYVAVVGAYSKVNDTTAVTYYTAHSASKTINVKGTLTFAKDSYVLVSPWGDNSASTEFISIKAATVKTNASVSAYTNTSVTVDGTKYSYNKYLVDDRSNTTAYSFVGTYDFVVDSYGNVIGIKDHTAAFSTASVVTAVAGFDKTVTTDYGNTTQKFVQTVALDGTVANYMVADNEFNNGTTVTTKLVAGGKYTVSGPDANGLYTLTTFAIAGGDPSTSAPLKADVLSANTAFTAKTTSVTLNNASHKAYITSDTKFVYFSGSKSTLKVTVQTGSITDSLTASNAVFFYGADKDGNYVVTNVVIGKTVAPVTAPDMLYVVTTAKIGATADGNLFEVYSATTGEKMVITCASSVNSLTAGFNTYTKNAKGVYALSAATTTTYTFVSKFGTKITATGSSELVDVEAGNAIIVDVDPTANEDAISTLAEFTTAKTTFNAVVDSTSNVTMIFVTNRA